MNCSNDYFEHKRKTTVLEGRKLCLAGRGMKESPCPVFFWPMSEEHGKTAEEAAAYVCSRVDSMTRESDRYLLAALTVKDWNRELSPWEAEIPEIGQSFGGGAEETLHWIREAAMPWIGHAYPGSCRSYYLAGYSLAGLFALWAEIITRKDRVFAGAAACSATMWFPGWLEYAKGQSTGSSQVSGGSSISAVDIYLSLGGKEHLTSNPFIAAILAAAREYEGLLDADPSVRRHTFEMNKGGHFSDPDGRVAKGIAWLLKSMART